MKIIDKFNETFGLSEKDEETVTDMSTNDELRTPQLEQNDAPIQPPPASTAGHNVVDFNSAIAARDNLMTNNNNNNLVKSRITTMEPKSFDDDAKIIADYLRDNVPIVVNFENTPPDHARRILDFVSGITYAIGGLVQNVSERVFICTPPSVTVTYEREEKHQEKDISWLTRRI